MPLQLFRNSEYSVFSEEDVWKWYCNIFQELSSGFLDDGEQTYLTAYYREAGLLRNWRRPFFRRHYAATFRQALTFLCDGKHHPLIVDLGCGTGSQSLAFALRGAHVIALDLDTEALEILEKRKRFYEQQVGRALSIATYNMNVFNFDFASIGSIDGVYSLFAFNMMRPTTALLDRIVPGLGSQARIVIQDGNRLSWLGRLPGRRRRVLSPVELDREFVHRDFMQVALKGGISIPPPMWAVLPYEWLSTVDSTLSQTWFWPISYLAMYQRKW